MAALEAIALSSSSVFKASPSLACNSESPCRHGVASQCPPSLSARSFLLPSSPIAGCLLSRQAASVSSFPCLYDTLSSSSQWRLKVCQSEKSHVLLPLFVASPAVHRRTLQVEARGGGRGGRRPRRGNDEPRPNKPSEIDPLYANGGVCPVPVDQQPVNEYRSLLESFPFSWAFLTMTGLLLRLGTVGVTAVLLIGWPVAALESDALSDPLRLAFGATAGGVLTSSAVALRLYLGWAYVENRLASATIEYEETGWYDGRMWVKPPPVLARDRLLQSYEVKPALRKLQLALFGFGAALLATAVVLTTLPVPSELASTPPEAERPMPSQVRPYSEESARFYEPNAFKDDDDEDSLGTATSMNRPMLPDFCF